METNNPESAERPQHRRRRRRKSSKASYQRRRELKNIGFWLVYGGVGILIATAIAILAGQSSN